MQNHIAVDIGASSGRLVWGRIIEGRMVLEEIHRFKNGFIQKDGHCFWEIDYLFNEIIKGLQIAKSKGIQACTLGIDTWAVDYVLLDEKGERLHEVFAYRDARTDQAIAEVSKQISQARIYEKTGIQFQNFNTLFQLSVHDIRQRKQAAKLLLVPDYLYYRLTGKLLNEATNASTTQLLNLKTQDYDAELLALLHMERRQFAELTAPGTSLGMIRDELQAAYDLPICEVICVATHDTASAVLGVPADRQESWAYLSSGTWSLLGVENRQPINSERARQNNFTNEWGAYGTYRFLKNIMGLWLIQEVQREYQGRYSFADFVKMASRETPFCCFIDLNDNRFLNPSSMIREIQAYCAQTGQAVLETPGQLARCIFDNLAILYALSIEELEQITGQSIEVVHIVGGGAYNELLCQLTATVSGKLVTAGPTESTAIGNLLVQMIEKGTFRDIHEARQHICRSFEIKKYLPQDDIDRIELLQAFRKHSEKGERSIKQ